MRTDRQWVDTPGWYAVRLVKGGAKVGCIVTYGPPRDPETGEPLDRSWRWIVTINGVETYNGPRPPAPRIGQRITEAEYRFLIADRQWAAENAPHLPEARPREAVARADRPIPFLETFDD